MSGFEELIAWRVSLQLANEIDAVTRGGAFRGDSALANQIRKAAVSISSNISEGYGRAKRAEFAHYLAIARGSAMEVQSQLSVALGAGRLTLQRYHSLRSLADRSVALVTKLRAAVIQQRDPE